MRRRRLTNVKKNDTPIKVLLLEIPSADHAFNGWIGGKAILKIFDLLSRFKVDYKLILDKKFLVKAIKDISAYDILHIECHSDQEGICYDPQKESVILWSSLAEILTETNKLRDKQLVISGCLAGNINSQAKILAMSGTGFKRVFAFDEEIEFDKAPAVWCGFYYLLSVSGRLGPPTIRQTVEKLRKCYDVKLLYFYPNNRNRDGVSVFPS